MTRSALYLEYMPFRLESNFYKFTTLTREKWEFEDYMDSRGITFLCYKALLYEDLVTSLLAPLVSNRPKLMLRRG